MILSRLMTRAGAAFFAALSTTLMHATAAPVSLEPARDLAADGKVAAANHQPVVVLVSLAGCPYCEEVRRAHLLPLVADNASRDAPLVRQIEFNGPQPVVDFAGTRISHAEFARRYRVKLAPVVLFFAPNGEMIAEPLVGSMIPEFYGAYFDAALAMARTKLQETIRP